MQELPLWPQLVRWTAAFFQLPVRTLPVQSLDGVTSRVNEETKRRQYLSSELLDGRLKRALPADALCLVGVTLEDLYPSPDPEWSFVFGQASLRDRVGVYSLCRYFPGFPARTTALADPTQVLRRSFKVVAHEIGHILGLHHCVDYKCVLNGSNSLDESDRRPLFLCPRCLKKLQWNIGFSRVARYKQLRDVLAGAGLTAEAAWVEARLAATSGSRRR